MVIKREERRGFPRIDFSGPVYYRAIDVSEFDNTVCCDISLGGIGFVSNKFIPPKTALMLEVNILSRVIRSTGQVIWFQSLPRSERNRLGLKFTELDPKDWNYLEEFINMKVQKL
jgi:c-di-GMP-binding flagellar brake protein YcgR